MAKQSGDTGNSMNTLRGESWTVSAGEFLDAAFSALKQAGSDRAERLLERLETQGVSGLTPDELEALQALVSQARSQGPLYAQATAPGVVNDANPEGAQGGTQNPAENGGDGGQQQNDTGTPPADQNAAPPSSPGGEPAAPPAPPVPGAGALRRGGAGGPLGADGGAGGGGDTGPLATGVGGQTTDGTGFGGGLGGGAAGTGLGGGAGGAGFGAGGAGFSAGAGGTGSGGGGGATPGSAPTGLSSDFGSLTSSLSGISLTSFNNFSFGNNSTGSQNGGAGFTVSTSLGGATVTSSSDAAAPFVQQSIGVNGTLAAQTSVSPLLTTASTQSSNSVSGTVGQGTITVQTVAPRTEQAQTPTTTPTTTQPPVVENPNGTVNVTAERVTVYVNADTGPASSSYSTVGSRLEGDESFKVLLSAVSPGTETQGEAVGVINNDDVRIQVTDLHTNQREGSADDPENPGHAEAVPQWITLERQGDPSQAVSIYWYVGNTHFTNNANLDETSAAFGQQMETVSSTSDGVTLFDLDNDGVAECGIVTWDAGDTAAKTLQFIPTADDVASGDWNFTVYVKPVPTTVDGHDYTAENASRTLIDEIGVSTAGSVVSSSSFATTGGIVLAAMTVKRDESGIWVSNQVEDSYDSSNSMPVNGTEQYNGWDYVTNNTTPWDGANRDPRDVSYTDRVVTPEGTARAATEGEDYSGGDATLHFTEDSRVQHVTLSLSDDSVREGFETVSVFVNDGADYGVDDDTAVVEIADDEAAAAQRIHVSGSTAIEGMDQYVTFKVTFGQPLAETTTLDLRLNAGGDDQASASNDLGGSSTLYFRHQTRDPDGNAVDDQLTSVLRFTNYEGSSLDSWLEFSDLEAGQSDLHVGGVADAQTLVRNGAMTEGEQGISLDIWVPVRADASFDLNTISLNFTGVEGSLTGAFIGVADLSDDAGLNADAIAFMARYSSAGSVSSAEQVQQYFQAQGADDVHLLKFTATIDWESVMNGPLPQLAWWVDGLDVSDVVAPQYDEVFEDLRLVQEMTVPAGESVTYFDVDVATDAQYDSNNGLRSDVLLPNADATAPAVAVEEFTTDGVHEIWMTVTRADATVADVVPYEWGHERVWDEALDTWVDPLLSGSSPSEGALQFAVGETSKTVVFRLDAAVAENLGYASTLNFDAQREVTGDYRQSDGPVSALVQGGMEYSLDGGLTWQSQSAALEYTYNYSDTNDSGVADRSTVVFGFNNRDGNGLLDWMEFSDLAAGQEDLHVGGVANFQALSNWGEGASETGITYSIWIPVVDGSVTATDDLSIAFAGMGTIQGTFAGIANLDSNDGLNAEAVAFMQSYTNGRWVNNASDVSNYFASEGAGNVDLLKFTLSVDWASLQSLDGAWRIDGLDVSDVVAPQWDRAFSNLMLIKDEVVAAGSDGNAGTMALADDASFLGDNVRALRGYGAFASQEALSYSLTSDTLVDGVRELHFQITRSESDSADAVPYFWNVSGNVLDGSAPAQGEVVFQEGESSVDLVFRVSSGTSYTPQLYITQWMMTEGASVNGVGGGGLQLGAGVEDVLVRYKVLDDSIDEGAETLSLTASTSNSDFVVNEATGEAVLIDDDAPELYHRTYSDTHFNDRGDDFRVEMLDVNCRNSNATSLDTLYYTMGSSQDFTVTLTLSGDWEVALVENSDLNDGSSSANDWIQHYSGLPWSTVSAGSVADDGTYTYALEVPAGTARILLRSLDDSASNTFDAEITHVDPVIVARNTEVDETAGTVNVEVVAVGGDLSDGGVDVNVSTEDGTWVDYTFVFSREFSATGEQTASWVVEAVSGADMPDGNDFSFYVNGYFASASLGTVSPDDFVILGDQSADATTGMPSGVVTFADGEKEATVTIRVRADAVGEPEEEFRVRLVETSDGAQMLGNPQASATYAQYYDYSGYARITDDDPVFCVEAGKALNESIDQIGVLAEAPEGYTLHTFTIVREGDATAAATVDWFLEVSGGGAVTSGGVIGSVSNTDMLATTADLGGSDAGAYALSWQGAEANGLVHSLAQTVTFNAGETSKVVTFAVKDDAQVELAEVFRVVLTNPQPLPGNETLPGVSETRGYADFLIGDNDGEKVSVAISTQVYDTNTSAYVVNDAQTVVDPASGLPMVEEGTSLASKNQVVLTFTRTGDLSAESQAYYEMTASDNNAASGMTLASGVGNTWYTGLWYGVVTFAANSATATVVYNVASDNLVEADQRVTVTLYDYEHLPDSVRAGANGFNGGANGPTIGLSSVLPNWDTTTRDSDAYVAEAVIKNDDVRLWLNSFTNTYSIDSAGYTTPTATVTNGGSVYEGGGDSGAGNDLTLTFARAGRQDNDIVLNWTIVHNGTDASDFAGTTGTLTLPGTSSTVQANDYTTQTVTLADFFAADYLAEENEGFQILFTSADTTNVKFTYDFVNEGNTHWGTGSAVSRAGTDTMKVEVTVLNDDVIYSIDNTANLSGGVAKVTEGAAGAVTDFTFDVHRQVDSADANVTGGYAGSSSVCWRVVTTGASHAVDASDFVLLAGQTLGDNGLPMGSVTFAGSVDTTDPEVLRQITLRVRGDSAVEYGEGFTIELYDPSIGHVDESNGSFDAVIVNDDTGIAINDVSVVEGNTTGGTTVQFTVTRSGALNLETSADWAKVDVSTDEADFTGATTGSVSFASTTAGMVDGYGEETRTVTLTYSGDDVPEADLDFNVQLSNFAGVSDIIDRTGTATLQNDDSVFSVAVSEGEADSHVEGDGQSYSFTITRTHDTAQAQTVQWAVAAGGGRNVIDADDFGGTLPSGSVIFQPGEFSKTVTFTGSRTDVTSEADERFVVHLTLGDGGDSSTVATNDAVGVVVNDDPGIYINDSQPVVQREGTGGSAVYQFDVTAFGLPAASTTSVNWEIVLDGTATADDFAGPLSGTVTFTENGTQTVSVGLATDSDLENSESFHIHLSNSDNIIASTNDALGTIGDDDYTLAVANAQVVEGDGRKSMQFVFTRTGTSSLPVEVSWSVAEGTASAADFPDGVLPSGSFTLPSGAASYTLSVPIQGDIVLEGDETFTLNASYDGGTISGTGTITNDDEEFAVAAIAAVEEGSAATPGTVQFTITRSGNLIGTSAVTWTIAGSGDHPAADADFRLLTGVVEFADGQSSQVVSVPLVGNGTAEFDKGYTVTLSEPAVASSISADHGTGDGVIANDDLGFAVTADQTSVVEGNDGTTTISWTVIRSGGDLSQSVTVDWALSGLTGDALQNADFDSLVSSGRVTFAADQTEATVSVTLVGDSHPETQTAPLSLVLSNPSAGGTLLTSSAEVSVMDDDDGFTIVAMDGDQMEGDSGTSTYTYRVTRSGVLSGESTVDWSVSGSGFRALSAAEFVGATSGTLTFADGESEKAITVQVTGDTVGEYDEAFTVSLSNASSGSEVLSGSVGNTVFNDDPVLFVSMDDTTVLEGDASADRAFTFVVRRSGDTTGTASVAWAIEAGNGNGVDAEDFGGLLPTGVVVFTPGQTEKTVTVLTSGDNDYELNETFNVVLSNAVNATILEGEVNNAVLLNDDTRVLVSVDHAQQAEGNTGDDTVFRFFLDAVGLADHVQIQWHLEGAGDHPLNGADYAAGVQTSGTTMVDLANNVGQEVVAVTINGDDVKGYDETFRFVVDDIIGFDANDNQVGAGLGGADAVTATVLDDDSLIGFHTTQASVAEGDSGTSMLSFVVSRAGSALALGSEVSVDYQVVGGFANSAGASDFLGGVLPSGTVTFAANQTEATISIAVQGDTLVEGDEKFSLTLANPTAGASISTTNAIAQGTILADDSGVQINCPMVSQGEDQARFTFDILRTGPLGEAVDMAYTLGTADQTAFDAGTGVSASDFTTALTGTIHFDAGQSQARFYVDVAHDSVAEADEHFAFQVDYGAASDWVDCTIVNDDIGSVTPPPDQLDVVEHHP